MAFKQIVVLTTSATVGTILYFAMDSWIVVTLLNMILMLILLKLLVYVFQQCMHFHYCRRISGWNDKDVTSSFICCGSIFIWCSTTV